MKTRKLPFLTKAAFSIDKIIDISGSPEGVLAKGGNNKRKSNRI
jgi:hypothetical protein